MITLYLIYLLFLGNPILGSHDFNDCNNRKCRGKMQRKTDFIADSESLLQDKNKTAASKKAAGGRKFTCVSILTKIYPLLLHSIQKSGERFLWKKKLEKIKTNLLYVAILFVIQHALCMHHSVQKAVKLFFIQVELKISEKNKIFGNTIQTTIRGEPRFWGNTSSFPPKIAIFCPLHISRASLGQIKGRHEAASKATDTVQY